MSVVRWSPREIIPWRMCEHNTTSRPRTDYESFLFIWAQLVNFSEWEGECLVMKEGNTLENGYVGLNGHNKNSITHWRAHIAAYQIWNGGVPKGLMVCHSCDNKRCVNPEHLWLGTNRDNQLDASRKGVFAAYWTEKRRKQQSERYSGEGNPMYGTKGELAPCYGRTGDKHPMYGKQHSEEAKAKISKSLLKTHRNKS